MTDSDSAAARPWHHPSNFSGALLLAVLILAWLALPGRRPDLGDWTAWAAAAAPLVIAAIAQTQIVLTGGQGLAAGSTALLVNALVGSRMTAEPGSMLLWSGAGILLGGAIGAFNGVLVGLLRLPSTAVTIATSFTAGGVTLALTGLSPPASPEAFRDLLTGEIVPGLPAPLLLTAALLVLAAGLDGSRLGRGLRRAGQDRVRHGGWVALAYILGGLGYGASGVFLAAELGMSDPTTSGTSLLEIYAAVALGGSVPLMRQGSGLGAALAALAISALGSLPLRLGLPDYTTPAITGLLLLAGMWQARSGWAAAPAVPAAQRSGRPIAVFGLPLTILAFLLFGSSSGLLAIDPLLLLMAGMLALAQATVVAGGHLDLSLAPILALAGLAAAALSQGKDVALAWVIPLILGGALVVGLVNGALGAWLKGPRVLVTLSATGVLSALSVALALGRPNGFAPPALMGFMSATPQGPAPAVAILGPLLLLVLGLLALPPMRRRLRALGAPNEPPPIRRAAPLIHGAAALLAAGVGIMLTGYGGQAPISAAEPFTLPSLLAIETAGLTVGRRGGNPAMLLLAVPMVTMIDTLMVGLGYSYPARLIAMGALLLAAVMAHGLAKPGWIQGRRA